jgi:hypothetical protein
LKVTVGDIVSGTSARSSYLPTPAETYSFWEGMLRAYGTITTLKPDAIIFPMRGAYPFHWACNEIAKLEEEQLPETILLPVGVCHDVQDGHNIELRRDQVTGIITGALNRYYEDRSRYQKLLLVDEVISGMKIKTIASHIRRYLRQHARYQDELELCPVVGERGRQGKWYQNRVAHGGLVIDVDSLFTVDNWHLLPTVVKEGNNFLIHTAEANEALNSLSPSLEQVYDMEREHILREKSIPMPLA